jgi:hypothetical protein
MIQKDRIIRGVLTEVAFVSIFISVLWVINTLI